MTESGQSRLAREYMAVRPMLMRIAYSVLGSVHEAEDVVSDCWMRLVEAHTREPVRDVEAWATVAVSRRSLDVLRSARVQRQTYIGPWLPEPLINDTRFGADPADRVTLDETVSYALLVVLESLSPAERTAWVLHDLFGMDFAQVAGIVGRSVTAVRQLASRARRHVAAQTPRIDVSPSEHQATVEAFAAACVEGNLEALIATLDPQVTATSDGAGEVVAAKRPLHGAERVAKFLIRLTERARADGQIIPITVNGAPGFATLDGTTLTSVISLTLTRGRIARIDMIAAPRKLRHLQSHRVR